MRIAFTNWSNRLAGGAEQYLATVAAHLGAKGHEISLWHETDGPDDRPLIGLPDPAPVWDAQSMGVVASLSALRAWRPDVIFCQGMLQPVNEALTQTIAPSVFFAHNYHGLCISGGRTLNRPAIQPCPHKFGPQCLLRYYPRRCGGLNPLRMLEDYRTNSERLEVLSKYSAVISHSDWMTAEYRRHGIACRQVRFFANREPAEQLQKYEAGSTWRLLMMGRMGGNKGGSVLLEAVPQIAAKLDRPVSLIFAGDGPSREAWERLAASVSRSTAVDIRFSGWLSGSERRRVLENTDLLLIPSLWPEPYGMVGLEAAQYGIPAVGFAVGGIPDWLKDGVNGCLAPADPPTPSGLAAAVIRCLSDPERYGGMRRQARTVALSMTIDQHYADLKQVFDEIRMNVKKEDARSSACGQEKDHGEAVLPSRVNL